MIALSFYLPSNTSDEDTFISQIWHEGAIDYLIYVKRISARGNPYIKGLLILKDESASLPSELELRPVPDNCLECMWRQFKDEQEMEQNAVEYGTFNL